MNTRPEEYYIDLMNEYKNNKPYYIYLIRQSVKNKRFNFNNFLIATTKLSFEYHQKRAASLGLVLIEKPSGDYYKYLLLKKDEGNGLYTLLNATHTKDDKFINEQFPETFINSKQPLSRYDTSTKKRKIHPNQYNLKLNTSKKEQSNNEKNENLGIEKIADENPNQKKSGGSNTTNKHKKIENSTQNPTIPNINNASINNKFNDEFDSVLTDGKGYSNLNEGKNINISNCYNENQEFYQPDKNDPSDFYPKVVLNLEPTQYDNFSYYEEILMNRQQQFSIPMNARPEEYYINLMNEYKNNKKFCRALIKNNLKNKELNFNNFLIAKTQLSFEGHKNQAKSFGLVLIEQPSIQNHYEYLLLKKDEGNGLYTLLNVTDKNDNEFINHQFSETLINSQMPLSWHDTSTKKRKIYPNQCDLELNPNKKKLAGSNTTKNPKKIENSMQNPPVPNINNASINNNNDDDFEFDEFDAVLTDGKDYPNLNEGGNTNISNCYNNGYEVDQHNYFNPDDVYNNSELNPYQGTDFNYYGGMNTQEQFPINNKPQPFDFSQGFSIDNFRNKKNNSYLQFWQNNNVPNNPNNSDHQGKNPRNNKPT